MTRPSSLARATGTLLLLLAADVGLPAIAYGADIDDIDDTGKPSKAKKNKPEDAAKADVTAVIREVEKGLYAKSAVGLTMWLGPNYGFATPVAPIFGGPLVKPGPQLAFAVGQEFLDQEKQSAAWEVAFTQGTHNGVTWELQERSQMDELGFTAYHIQGDVRSFMLMVNGEYSYYPTRRIGIGARLGAGLMLTPLLMKKDFYYSTVVPAWNGFDPAVTRTPHPWIFAGPTFEYYTKLSHFSVGVDIDVGFAIGFDLGIMSTGYVKYTF